MAIYKVKKLYVSKFRRLHNQTVEIGNCITLIAGQNGTSKSTLLGLIAQPFNFKDDSESKYVHHYTGIDFESCITITGQKFESDYRQIFRLSEFSDKPGDHLYRIYIEGEDLLNPQLLSVEGLPVKSRVRNQTKNSIRLVAGVTHTKGEGNFPHPIIYLGLGRLIPLAQCSKLRVGHAAVSLNESEVKWLHETNKKILSLEDSPNGAEIIEPSWPGRPAYPAASYERYKPDTYSSGQDNLGQILISLLSFRRLKEKLGPLYAGGIIFVDELDAVLFPSAQKTLLEVLVEEAKQLSIQIIATTHSVSMLEGAMKSKLKSDIRVVYLAREDEEVVVKNDLDYEAMRANLKITRAECSKPQIFLEDAVAVQFFKSITQNALDDLFEYAELGGYGFMKQVSENHALKKLVRGIYVYDGDFPGQCDINALKLPNLCKMSPEVELYSFLQTLSDGSSFWQFNDGFVKQLVFKHHKYTDYRADSNHIKTWFTEMCRLYPDYFGHFGERAVEYWRQANLELVREFIDSLQICVQHVFAVFPEYDEMQSALQSLHGVLVEKPLVSDASEDLFDWGKKNQG